MKQVIHGPTNHDYIDILEIVADLEDASIADLPPLYDSIDPELITRFFERPTAGSIRFEYLGYEITVGQELITVRETGPRASVILN